MQKWNLYLTILFSVFSFSVKAQTPQQTIEFAKEQFRIGNHETAVKALNRLLFFSSDTFSSETFSLLANSYFQQKDYSNAYYYFDLASIQCENDSLRAEFTTMKVACRLYNREFHEAQIDILTYSGRLNPAQQWQFNLLSGITSFYLDDYNAARSFFLKCADTSNQQSFIAIETGFERFRKLERRYNPRMANLLSIILPGAGQMYSGDFRNGINSMALVAGLIFATVGLASSISFIDSAIIIFPWFQRYYTGGYQRASATAQEKQRAGKNEALGTLISSLEKGSAR